MHAERHVSAFWRAAAIFPFILAIRAYQVTLAPLMSGHCRFIPTCSNYAIDAYRQHGPWRGSWLTARRLLRCHPWGGSGFDPVPEARAGSRSDGA
jgi:putative membrane protein insertion efficiency factor